MVRSGALFTLSAFFLFASCVESNEAPPLYNMYFYVKEEFWGPELEDVDEISGHPCGAVYAMEVSRIPEFPEDGMLVPSKVVEFDERGEIIATWQVPADYVLNGVRSDDLLIDFHGLDWTRAWVGQDGSIEDAVGIERDDAADRACPIQIKRLYGVEDEADYPFCSQFQDRETGLPRNLAYEPVCT